MRTYHNNSTGNRRCGADDREVKQADFVQSVDCFEIDVCLFFCITHELYASRTMCVEGEVRGEEERNESRKVRKVRCLKTISVSVVR